MHFICEASRKRNRGWRKEILLGRLFRNCAEIYLIIYVSKERSLIYIVINCPLVINFTEGNSWIRNGLENRWNIEFRKLAISSVTCWFFLTYQASARVFIVNIGIWNKFSDNLQFFERATCAFPSRGMFFLDVPNLTRDATLTGDVKVSPCFVLSRNFH